MKETKPLSLITRASIAAIALSAASGASLAQTTTPTTETPTATTPTATTPTATTPTATTPTATTPTATTPTATTPTTTTPTATTPTTTMPTATTPTATTPTTTTPTTTTPTTTTPTTTTPTTPTASVLAPIPVTIPSGVSTSSGVVTRAAGSTAGTFTFGTPLFAGPDGTSFLSIPPPSVTPTTTTPSTTTPTTTTPSTTTPSSNFLNLRVDTGGITHAQDFDLRTGTRGSPITTGTGSTATTTSSPFVQFNGIQNSTETIEIYRPGNSTDLNFSSFGAWDTNTVAANVTGGFGVIASGQNTPVGAVPTTGTATYTGGTTGFLQTSSTSAETRIRGTASVTANFATAAITGAFNIPGQFAFTGNANIAAGTNTYSGTTATTSIANSSLPAALSGDLRGAFYGPAAQETAGTWTLKGGQAQAIGAFGAKR